MKIVKKALAAAVLAVVCGSALASSVPAGSITLYDGMSSETLNTSSLFGQTYDPVFYELNVTDVNGARAFFTLIDTDPDNVGPAKTVEYTLYDDSTVATNSISIGTQLFQTTITDNNTLGSEGYFSYFFAQGQYVLKMATNMLAPASSTSVVSAVPLPAAAWLFGSALLGLGVFRRRKQVAAV